MATVLRRTRLAAYLELIPGQGTAGSSQDGGPHALYHIIVGLGMGLGIVAAGESRVERFALHLAHHMGHIVVATVGDGRPEIGYLQRGGVNLTLANGDTDNGQSIPGAFVSSVIELGIGYQSALLARQVDTQPIAEAHTHHIVAPGVHRILHTAILAAVADHIIESPTEEGIAGGTQGRHQRQG